MSDSFADLWNSTAPTKPTPPPQKLGSISQQSSHLGVRRPQNDVFSMLSSAGSSAPNSRPITPSMSSAKPAATAKSARSGDAFSTLLAGSIGAQSNNSANMTIAERAAKVERERREMLLRSQQNAAKAPTMSAWDGLDTLAQRSSPASLKPSTASTSNLVDDDWGFGAAAAASTSNAAPKAKPVSAPTVDDDDWGLGDFASAPSTSKPAKAPPPARQVSAKSQAIWDLDEFSEVASESPPPRARQRSDSPGEDFDFGNREDRLLDDDENDGDDILGVLSKPVPKHPPRSAQRSTPSPNGQPKSTSRPSSPPPHILGQLVEMGFSIQQAKVALASTDTGLDVQAALEILISNGATGPSTSSSPSPPQQQQRTASTGRRPPAPARERSDRFKSPGERGSPSPAGGSSSAQGQDGSSPAIQEQADKILAQASEIGLSFFNKASSVWKETRDRAQKAYIEKVVGEGGAAAESNGNAKPPASNGRPKWMQQHPQGDDGWDDHEHPAAEQNGGFSDDVDHRPERTRQTSNSSRNESPKPPPPQQSSGVKAKIADLFSDEPVAYVSPFRRGKSTPQASSSSLFSSSSPSTSAVPAPSPPTQPKPQAQRAPPPPTRQPRLNLVSASLSSISQSSSHKATGGEKFKLGQYAEAEAAYTRSIECLPARHLLLVPLYNNRALVRLKNGDYASAAEDAAAVVEIVGEGWREGAEEPVRRKEDGSEVDLGGGLLKAWKRRAEALEGREKWDEAKKDWERVAGAGWASASVRGEGVRGAGRCRRMITEGSESKPKPRASVPPPSRPRPAVRRGTTPPSQALTNLRKANTAAEAEDQAKFELKDVVDAKLVAWKGGKETNIRALIASLDTVLWPDIGLQKSSMADLISPGQVKIRYMKAIAKLHPDKLNTNNSTIEQRMIANGVFGTLNEAWNAFKQ